MIEFSSAISLAEFAWFLGIILFSVVIFLGKNNGRGFVLNIGAVLLILGYSVMLKESILSFTEIAVLKWVIRFGITLILFDLANRTEVKNPIPALKSFFAKFKRGKK